MLGLSAALFVLGCIFPVAAPILFTAAAITCISTIPVTSWMLFESPPRAPIELPHTRAVPLPTVRATSFAFTPRPVRPVLYTPSMQWDRDRRPTTVPALQPNGVVHSQIAPGPFGGRPSVGPHRHY